MALVTVRILDGPDRGRGFYQVSTPVTIGREEGNLIQLNDHRVSRNHVKIHESGNAVLMTDLQSTNGTKINGEMVHVWQLQPGDLITLGRSMLLFGATSEIAERLEELKRKDLSHAAPMGTGGDEIDFLNRSLDSRTSNGTLSSTLFAKEAFGEISETDLQSLQLLPPPEIPANLPPPQAAQMEALLQYFHLRLRHLITTVRSAPVARNESQSNMRISLSITQWQNLLDLHAKIASYMSLPPEDVT